MHEPKVSLLHKIHKMHNLQGSIGSYLLQSPSTGSTNNFYPLSCEKIPIYPTFSPPASRPPPLHSLKFNKNLCKMSATTSAILRAARPAFRNSSNFFTQHQAHQAQAQINRNVWGKAGRRWQSTATGTDAAAQGWVKRMWDSPIGLKTVHFW